ncbi:MAG: glutamine synthetase family protein [Chloroflexi bacterium]|nr:glutamine synthetase [Dehalococcoidia bacterium]MCO5202392.1 glutamine synthetase family protein [Chloroflexota bacterium]MCZ7576950.1 glutamine synthetase family protein [Dehalococcoidia bacterium]NJD66501.1 glutamine synthetase [Chloroflexota bacterium]PWB46970.1 MAG: glutamine synthetase [Dehalococcoidia bacterium]
MSESASYVISACRENDVKFIRLWFTDIVGALKSFAITVEELEKALEEGMGFDGSSIEGFARIDESDMIARPDPATFQLVPWRPREAGVARMFCDIYHPDGEPFAGDPRFVLKRQLKRAADLGYTFYVSPELEYFYFKTSDRPEPLDRGGYFDQTSDAASDLRRETVLALEAMGIEVEYSHHEVAPSQHEIALRYTDALTMADAAMTYRLVVKEIALANGVYATFMPKPLADYNGSGMHVHQSLFKGERNAFFDPADPYHLSAIARSYIAGLLHHSTALTLVTNQWVNSYKRLLPGFEAPVYITWARRNRSDLVRIPEYKPGKETHTRIEYRSPDSACNPYLAFAVMLAAGLDGIEHERPIPAPVEENVFELTAAERDARGIETLPGSLIEAIEQAERSPFLRNALGDHTFESLIKNKRIEWERYRRHVSDFELAEYLPIL